jgi:hypothetical protein
MQCAQWPTLRWAYNVKPVLDPLLPQIPDEVSNMSLPRLDGPAHLVGVILPLRICLSTKHSDLRQLDSTALKVEPGRSGRARERAGRRPAAIYKPAVFDIGYLRHLCVRQVEELNR